MINFCANATGLEPEHLQSPQSSRIATFVQKDKGGPNSGCDKIGLNANSPLQGNKGKQRAEWRRKEQGDDMLSMEL